MITSGLRVRKYLKGFWREWSLRRAGFQREGVSARYITIESTPFKADIFSRETDLDHLEINCNINYTASSRANHVRKSRIKSLHGYCNIVGSEETDDSQSDN